MPHLDAAYRFARWLARSAVEADDIVQEAFLRAFRAFDTLRGGEPKAWLFTIVRNCHATAVQQQRRRGEVGLAQEADARPWRGGARRHARPGERLDRAGSAARARSADRGAPRGAS